MGKTLILLLTVLLLTSASSCDKEDESTGEQPEPKQIKLTASGAEVVGSSNDFGIQLFTETARQETGNLMLSPLSASAALTMLLNGCEEETYEQIRDMLGYPADMGLEEINETYQGLVRQLLDADPKVKLALANAVFYRDDFEVKTPFMEVMDDAFDANIEGLDFGHPSTVDVINQWAGDNTEGRIDQVIDEIDPLMMMFLMNALYFKGEWTQQFDEADTRDRPFFPDEDNEIEVPTMIGEVGIWTYEGDGYRVAEMPYGRTNFSMVVIVPDNGLSTYYEDFSPAVWQEITASLDQQPGTREITVMMPKFEFEYEKVLNDQLKGLGMTEAFEPRVADLSGISDEEIFVSFVKQNTFVEVNEEGTEAAAVTTIGIEVTSIGPEPSEFIVDQPFIFAIRERTTNSLLFIGSVNNPVN
ncbi:MAG: serpin family protein [Bacteroidales bacterium]